MAKSVILLDQNAWILLARAHYNPNRDHSVDEVLGFLKGQKNNKKCVFPLTLQRLQETMKIGDTARRQKLARFMVDLSSGYCSGCADETLLEMECHNHLADYFKLHIPRFNVREKLIGVGLAGIFGDRVQLTEAKLSSLPPDLLGDKSPCARERNELYFALSDGDANGRNYLRAIDDFETLAKEQIEHQIRSLPTMKERGSKNKLRREEVKAFAVEIVIPAIAQLCKSLGVDFDEWHGDEDNVVERTVESIPSVKVTVELVVGRDRQSGGIVKVNDFRDVSFLAAALPYSDCVVTDRYWSDMVRRTGLARLYGVHVLSDIRQLPRFFDSQGEEKRQVNGWKRHEHKETCV